MQALESIVRESGMECGSLGSGVDDRTGRRDVLRAGVGAAVACLFSGKISAQEPGYSQTDSVKNSEKIGEKLPVFKTMDEWGKSSLLGDERAGFFNKMRTLSNRLAIAKTSLERRTSLEEISELANMILREIGNPPPPTVLRKLQSGYYNRDFSGALLGYLWQYTPAFPLKIQAGEVNGELTVEYLRRAIALPVEVADEATQRILRETLVKIDGDQTLHQTVANLCNASGVDLDIGPIGTATRTCETGQPEMFYFAYFGPLSRLHYSASRFGVSVGGTFVDDGSAQWSFYSGAESQENPGKKKSEGFWAPDSFIVQKAGTRVEESLLFPPDIFPLQDPESGKLLMYDEGRGILCFSDASKVEKGLTEEPPHLVWKKPRMSFFSLDEWHHKKEKFKWGPRS